MMLTQRSVNSDWLFNTQSRVLLQGDWLMLEHNESATWNINMIFHCITATLAYYHFARSKDLFAHFFNAHYTMSMRMRCSLYAYALYTYALYTYALYTYALYTYALYTYTLNTYTIYTYALYGYALYRYALLFIVPQPNVLKTVTLGVDCYC